MHGTKKHRHARRVRFMFLVMITCSTQKTLDSYDKVNSTSLFGYDTQGKNRNCFTLGAEISNFHYFYQGMVVTVDQWL